MARVSKAERFIRRTILFSIPQDGWIIAEAERLGISIGELIRRIIDRERLQSSGDSGRSDATRLGNVVDDVVRRLANQTGLPGLSAE